MKKILPLILSIFALFILSSTAAGRLFAFAQEEGAPLSGDGNASKTISGKNLQYFELKNPVSVYRADGKVYIAEPSLLVIYENDTYETVALDGFEVSRIEKCGRLLLFLSGSDLCAVNLEKNELVSKPLYTHVDCFSVCGDTLLFGSGGRVYFATIDESGLTFSDYSPTCEIQLIGTASALSLNSVAPEESYYYSSGNVLRYISGTTTYIISSKHSGINRIRSIGDDVYFSVSGDIYKINRADYTEQLVFSGKNYGIESAGDFFIDEDKMLVCDKGGNRVIEYDLTKNVLTGLEISFTKIFLPDNFGFTLTRSPSYVTVADKTELYDIDLTRSLNIGYFVFNGYFTQNGDGNYLVLKEFGDYYLISGEKIALVMKEDFGVHSLLPESDEEQTKLISNDVRAFLLPLLHDAVASFKINARESVTVLSVYRFNGVKYAFVRSKDSYGYIPQTYLVESFYTPKEDKRFTTATTSAKTSIVYSDEQMKIKQDELGKYSTVLIYEEKSDCYYVSYGDGKFGFIAKSSVTKRGILTDRIVAAVTLLIIAVTATSIYLINKYLYNK